MLSMHSEVCTFFLFTMSEKDGGKPKTIHTVFTSMSAPRWEYCTSNTADITVMLPSHLLYFPISGKLYLISALPLRLFSETFNAEETRNKAQSRTWSAILKWKTEMGKGSLAEMLFG